MENRFLGHMHRCSLVTSRPRFACMRHGIFLVWQFCRQSSLGIKHRQQPEITNLPDSAVGIPHGEEDCLSIISLAKPVKKPSFYCLHSQPNQFAK